MPPAPPAPPPPVEGLGPTTTTAVDEGESFRLVEATAAPTTSMTALSWPRLPSRGRPWRRRRRRHPRAPRRRHRFHRRPNRWPKACAGLPSAFASAHHRWSTRGGPPGRHRRRHLRAPRRRHRSHRRQNRWLALVPRSLLLPRTTGGQPAGGSRPERQSPEGSASSSSSFAAHSGVPCTHCPPTNPIRYDLRACPARCVSDSSLLAG